MSDRRTGELARRSRDWYQANAHRYDRLHPGLPGDATFYAALARDRVVLEVGAGTGRVTAALADAARSLVALDVAPAMLDVAARRLGARPGAHLLAADGRALPLCGSFEAIVLPYRTVHHLNRPDRVTLWRELRRVAAPGGLLAFDWWSGPISATSGRGGQPPTAAIDESGLVLELLATGWVVQEDRRGFGATETPAGRTRVWVARTAGRTLPKRRGDEGY